MAGLGSILANTYFSMLPSYNDVAYDVRLEADGSFMITDPTNEAAFLDIVAVNEAGRS